MFNAFLGDLDKAIGKSRHTATAVGEGASSQAAAVQETSAAVTQITSTVRNNADNAQHANELMRLANQGVT